MFCRDQSLTLLAKHGYNVVRLPRTGIEPLDVLGRDHNGIERLGRLPVIWHSNVAVPTISDGNVAAEIKAIRTSALKVSFGLKILEDILSGLGGAAIPRLDTAYSAAESLQFAFGNIRIGKVDPFDVGTYLKGGDLQVGNPFVDRYFFEDSADTYIITEVLKSDSVTVIPSSKSDLGGGVDISAIQNSVGAAIKVETGSESKSAVTYKGPTHLTFGFKAFRAGYDYDESGVGSWVITGINTNKGDVYLDASELETQPVLLTEVGNRIGRVELR